MASNLRDCFVLESLCALPSVPLTMMHHDASDDTAAERSTVPGHNRGRPAYNYQELFSGFCRW